MRFYTTDELSRFIDHTNLYAEAEKEAIKRLCQEAVQYHFKMVAVNQVQTAWCAQWLKDTDVNVGAAISFPLGQTSIEAKIFETQDAIKKGAGEIDYVINITELKNQNYEYITQEMEGIVNLCKKHGIISKVIFENCYLTKNEIIRLCEIANKVKPDFVKTSTGFGTGGATFEDVKLMRYHVNNDIKVKAAGGIRDLDTFIEMIRLGARRIGTSSGIPIIKSLKERLEKQGTDTIQI